MKTFNDAQLEKMRTEEPDRYFYYSHEEQYKELGINLDNKNWELPLYHYAGKRNGKNKFQYFREIVDSPTGATILAHDGRLVNVTHDCKIEELCKPVGREPVFQHDEPLPAPAPLGFWFNVLHFITRGRYGANRYAQYQLELNEHNSQVQKLEEDRREWEQKVYNPYQRRVQMVAEYRNGLTQLDKKPEEAKAYMAEDKKRYNKEKKLADDLALQKSHVNTAVHLRERGIARLDYLMGPHRGTEREALTKKQLLEDEHTLRSYCFDGIGTSENNETERIMDIEYPQCQTFSDHEIALLGFADMCSTKFINKTHSHPIPGSAEVPDNRSDFQKFVDQGSWYNITESLFTRQQRDSTAGVPWLNNARADVATALEKYNNGDMTAVAEMLKNGMRWCSHHVMYQTSTTDTNTLADYALYAGEMLDMVNRNPTLRKAVLSAGATLQDLRDAEICGNIGKVWDSGINAMADLKNNPNMSPDQKADAIVHIIGLRMTQDLLFKNSDTIKNSSEYDAAFNTALSEYQKADADRMNMSAEDRKDPQKTEAVATRVTLANNKLALFSYGFLFDQLGIQLSFGKVIEEVYSGDNGPKNMHDTIRSQLDLVTLSQRSNDEILTEMLPQNAAQYIKKVVSKDSLQPQQPAVKTTQLKKQNQLDEPAGPGGPKI